MKIELLVIPGCPNAEPASDLVQQALDELGLNRMTFTTRIIADPDEAARAGFTGSPAFLIDGRDPFAEPGQAPGLTCRIYRTPHGPAGVPGVNQLRQALADAL
ncbi:hypothetical protein [Streptomyces mirabilis]|uniref:hypothetical protein n=1 Tax=Streptomyces TaxID=1883 RepID=UPI0036C05B99